MNMYLLTHASECNMRFILRVIFFPQLFARTRSVSANNREENDEQNKSHIAREACVNRFIVRPKNVNTISYGLASHVLKIETPQRQLVKTSITLSTTCIVFTKSRYLYQRSLNVNYNPSGTFSLCCKMVLQNKNISFLCIGGRCCLFSLT